MARKPKIKTNIARPSVKATTFKNKEARYIHKTVLQEAPRGRQDIAKWTSALDMARSVTNPLPYRLYQLFDNILLDTVLSNQMDLRIVDVTGEKINFIRDGEIDVELTKEITNKGWFEEINRLVLEAIFYKFSLVELSLKNNELVVDNLPRTNVILAKGRLLFDVYSTQGVDYRELKEYGTTILEFVDNNSNTQFGLLNKMVPHALTKRFALGCWGEYGEIAGIPFRVVKTDTENAEALSRLENMVKDIGSAPYAIIDETETVEWANNNSSHNGDVFRNLASVCDSQMSVGIRGAIVGQDTLNGNYSKEAAGIEVADKLTKKDKKSLATAWNTQIIPALVRLGVLPEGVVMAFQEEVNLDELFGRVKEVLPYKKVDNEWFSETFGIPVSDKDSGTQQELSLNDFFV